MSVLQDGLTWDGRQAPDPRDGSVMKILTKDARELLTPAELAALPGPAKEAQPRANRGRSITSDTGIPANEAAEMLGYGHDGGQQLLKDLAAAPDREQRVNDLTEAHMQAKYPDAFKDPVASEHEADVTLHASQTRARLLELEANLLERKAATDAVDKAEGRAAKGEAKIVAQRGAAAQQVALAVTRDEIARMSGQGSPDGHPDGGQGGNRQRQGRQSQPRHLHGGRAGMRQALQGGHGEAGLRRRPGVEAQAAGQQ